MNVQASPRRSRLDGAPLGLTPSVIIRMNEAPLSNHECEHEPFATALQPRGKAASIAATTAGASGFVLGLNRVIVRPSAATTNFSKFHRMSPE